MRVTLAAVVASLVVTASAHATVYGVWINGVFKGDGRNNYIRSPPNNNPVKDITSDAVACNVNNRRVPNTLDVKSGDKFTFEWYHDKRDDDIIASSHKGPVVVYIAPASSNGAGDVWVKLYEESWDGTWAVDKIIAAHGQHSINIPNLPAGEYLLRSELLTLHESDARYDENPIRGIQLYPSCVQVRVTSNGSNALPTGVSFPGAYAYTDYGIHFNLYNYPAASYVIPGPAVWSGAAGGSIGQVGVAKVAKVAA
ncbi:glycoside hydrolase family 61 protein [Botryobasidium botryosum FD-172 SS1]|uniref:AA9 family lytic polysaccharide monooxygenase n=1 Tax=Botryobasidium botryosum (strain FD-172 SS1) TaxID=930990 RepID=A0A067LUS6_BOTB1|nr:glycoside hydrolase family 61 protein [Botryobasidium botryosum FD-172 SS1]